MEYPWAIGRRKKRTRCNLLHRVRPNWRSVAAKRGISLCIEAVNRFDHHLICTAKEAIALIEASRSPHIKINLDTFHINIEEESFLGAFRTAGHKLGHLHLSNRNRGFPSKGDLPWEQMAAVLHEIGYDGAVVLEPFVQAGTGGAANLNVWRDLYPGEGEQELDRRLCHSLAYIKELMRDTSHKNEKENKNEIHI